MFIYPSSAITSPFISIPLSLQHLYCTPLGEVCIHTTPHVAHMKCFTWMEAPFTVLDIHNNKSGLGVGVAISQSISFCIGNYLTALCWVCTAQASRRHRSSAYNGYYGILRGARDHFLENKLKMWNANPQPKTEVNSKQSREKTQEVVGYEIQMNKL